MKTAIEYAVDDYEDRGPGGVILVKRVVRSEEEALRKVREQVPGWPVRAYKRVVGEWIPFGGAR